MLTLLCLLNGSCFLASSTQTQSACCARQEQKMQVQYSCNNVQDTKKSCQQLIIHYCPFPLTIDLLFSAEYDVCMAGSCGNYAQRLI